MTSTISTEQLLSLNLPNLEVISGSRQAVAHGISPSDAPKATTLVFASTTEDVGKALQSQAQIVVAIKKALIGEFRPGPLQCLISVDDMSEAMTSILALADDKKNRVIKVVSSTAAVASSARLGKNLSIGHFAVIGEGAIIGDRVIIGPHVVIEKEAQIGADSYIHPNVVIGARCQIGQRCEIHSGTVIGSDGFGYWTKKDLTHQKIPQIGIVVLEDDVEIGANCAIDRATIAETRISKGTKFDNLIHFAHNCKIGKNSRITAGFMTAGSTEIGENFLSGGVCQVTDHVRIADNVVLAGRSGVTKNVDKAGVYGGYPLEPLKDAMKTIANIGHLTAMRKQLHQIRKHLGLVDESEKQS